MIALTSARGCEVLYDLRSGPSSRDTVMPARPKVSKAICSVTCRSNKTVGN